MKVTNIFSSFTIAMLLGACGNPSSAPSSYIIEGQLPDSSFHGKQIYLQRYSDGKMIDTTLIEGDHFTFTGVAKAAEYCRIDINTNLYNNLIIENGNINIEMVYTKRGQEPPLATGTKGNEEYAQIKALSTKLREDYIKSIDSLRAIYSEESELIKAIEPYHEQYQQAIVQKGKELFAAHKDDFMVYPLFQTRFYQNLSIEERHAIIESLAEDIRNSNFVKNELDKVLREEEVNRRKQETGEGKLYTNVNGTDINGKPSQLSDYVGKGNYVLVDFWASWCGPCRGEIPYLKQLYQKYNGKGFTILGIYVWDNVENMKTALKEEKISWPQLFDSEKTATQIYGVDGIPQIILFGPDGTILKRNLRGENMVRTVSEYVESK